MVATAAKVAFLYNMYTGSKEPLRMRGLFQAGATQAIFMGEILELTADTNTRWTPMDSDFAGAGNVAVADELIRSGDRAGYFWIIVPRPGDVFKFALATASAIALGASLYWSDSQTLKTSGSNALGVSVGQEHYPRKQGHLSDGDGSSDAGETIRSTSFVHMTFKKAVSYYAVLET